ncbi:MAG TPA: HAD-IB family hydrolase [Acidimicrobiales bacterium]|nr:HAD-IB family hydrolase [Acidimicrobiales bacterium]
MAAKAAAFFDLDRTLLKGASGPVFTAALREAGVIPDRHIPGEGAVYKIFDLFGENLASMALTRQAARVATGWSADAVVEAATQAAKLLTGAVAPYARQLMDEHRAAGRPVILATTSPFDMVKPFADELGLDDVIATTYGRDAEGRYDGSIVGSFVWGTGKLDAVRAYADANGIDLRESYAYSDSVFDVPLLSAVGHPTAVNPDAQLRVVAAVRRWKVLHLDAPPGVPKVMGVEPWSALRPFMSPLAFPYARFDIQGVERIPAEGPGIVVANHRSYFDTAAVGLTVAPSGRPLRFLGKKEVFDAPVVGQLAKAMGGIRVERGSGSDEPLKVAARALDAGELVAMMPQGTIPRGKAFFEPELKGRWGAARLARMTGAPIIPIGLWGTERVWPRSSMVPNVLNVVSPPLVRTRVGDPFSISGEDLDEDTRQIMDAIVDLLPPEAKVRREPTIEELRRTIPSSYKGDPEKYGEEQHRPGKD